MPTHIPYQLTLEAHSNYLYAYVEAPQICSTTAVTYLREIRAECDRLGIKRVLIERRIPHTVSIVGYFNIAGNSLPILGGIRTAWFNPYPENQEMLEFATLAANNRGAQCGVFTDKAEATDWLLGHSSAVYQSLTDIGPWR